MLLASLTLTTCWPILICSTYMSDIQFLPMLLPSAIDFIWFNTGPLASLSLTYVALALPAGFADHRIWLGIDRVVIYWSLPGGLITFVVETMVVVRDQVKVWKSIQTVKSIRTLTPRDGVELPIREVPLCFFLPSPPHLHHVCPPRSLGMCWCSCISHFI